MRITPETPIIAVERSRISGEYSAAKPRKIVGRPSRRVTCCNSKLFYQELLEAKKYFISSMHKTYLLGGCDKMVLNKKLVKLIEICKGFEKKKIEKILDYIDLVVPNVKLKGQTRRDAVL